MNNTVSQALIRDSEGWFVLMDVEESSATIWHDQQAHISSSSMGWRDIEKIIESEDETAPVDHGNGSDSDTKRISLVKRSLLSFDSSANHAETEGVTKKTVIADNQTPIPANATIELPEQDLRQLSIRTLDNQPNNQELDASKSSRYCSSGKGTYMEDDPDTTDALITATEITDDRACIVAKSLPDFQNSANHAETREVTKDTAVPDDRTPIPANATIELPEPDMREPSITTPDNQAYNQEPNASKLLRHCSEPYMEDGTGMLEVLAAATGITNDRVGTVADSSLFPLTDTTIDPNAPEPRTRRSSMLEDLLARFEGFVMMDFPFPQALFKVGALMYLLFLIKVLWKIWTMFQTQPLAVGVGNLGLSIALMILIRVYVPEHVEVQVDQVGSRLLSPYPYLTSSEP
ncbi:hypothetical protein EV361DRAFT_954618 [Lentinula raphanica]|nr:hypothetical protein EV361DRAFT_954618 [Lentinula raphanica]